MDKYGSSVPHVGTKSPVKHPVSDPKKTNDAPVTSFDPKSIIPAKPHQMNLDTPIQKRQVKQTAKASLFKQEDVYSLQQKVEKLATDQQTVRRTHKLLKEEVKALDEQMPDKRQTLYEDAVSAGKAQHDRLAQQKQEVGLRKNAAEESSLHQKHQLQLIQLTVLKQNLNKYQQKISELKKQLDQFKNQPQSLHDNEAFTEIKNQLENIKIENEKLKSTNDQLEAVCTEQKETVELRAKETAALRDSLDISTAEAEDLTKKLTELKEISTHHKHSQALNEALSKEFEQQSQEVEEFKQRLLEKEQQIKNLEETQLSLQQQLLTQSEQTVTKNKHDAVVEKKQQEIQQAQITINQLKNKITALKNAPHERLKQAQKELNKATIQKDETDRKYQELLKTNEQLIKTMDQQYAYITELKNQLSQGKTEN